MIIAIRLNIINKKRHDSGFPILTGVFNNGEGNIFKL